MSKVSLANPLNPTIVLLVLFSFGCSESHTASNAKNIFGNDTRSTADTNALPYSAIGRIDSGCTGFLIGKTLAATAAHCLVDSAGAIKKKIQTFGMDFKNGVPKTKANIKNAWIGTFNPEDSRSNDWAILELDRPLGNSRGFISLETNALVASDLPAISLAGYQSDYEKGEVLAVDKACRIRKIAEDSRVFFDCDSYAGISGAPLLKITSTGTYAIGIAVSEFRSGSATSVHRDEYSDDYANVGIGVDQFSLIAQKLKTQVEQGASPATVDGAFFISVPEPEPNVRIDLVSDAAFSGGMFTDNHNQIRCDGVNADCSGSYVQGTEVTLTAPPTLLANGRRMRFQFWMCVDARAEFSGENNVCTSRGRQCQVNAENDLKCSAWYN